MREIVILTAMLVSACAAQPKQDDSKYGAGVGVVNHTGKFIYSAVVDGAGGANMPAWGAGYPNVCCAMMPTKWHPGIRVLVQWDVPEGSTHVYKEKLVEVEKYEEQGSIYMHFFPNDEVRVVVSEYFGASPQHPIPRPRMPILQPTQ